MVLGLSIACVVLLCCLMTSIGLYVRSHMLVIRLGAEIKRFGEIKDLEQYKDQQRTIADAAKGELTEARLALVEVKENLKVGADKIQSQEAHDLLRACAEIGM